MRRVIAGNVIGRLSLKEAAAVPESEPVNVLRDDDALTPGLVLMGNAVVERLQDALLVVLRNFRRQHLVFGQDPYLHISDA